MSTVTIIDYGAGNLRSAAKAFERAARETGTGARIVVTSDPETVAAADRVVLPGVGAYADCRRGLDAVSGMVEAMTEAAHGRGRPFLGICVGMQLLASRGLEYEVTPGLGWIPGDVAPITPADPRLKVPHPHLHERAFALVPLAEIAAAEPFPGHGCVGDALAGVDAGGVVAIDAA